jgi:hypothetical protein
VAPGHGREPLPGRRINSFDPPLTAVGTSYPTKPFLPFFHPPIELTGLGPRGLVYLDRRIDYAAVCFVDLLHVIVAEIHI